MTIHQSIIDWRKAGKHLPPPLRDFHDQKDVFRLIHWLTQPPSPDQAIRHPSWVDGQIYVIDTFLWCMARHSYTLQRSRAKLPFESLVDNIKALRAEESEAFAQIMGKK